MLKAICNQRSLLMLITETADVPQSHRHFICHGNFLDFSEVLVVLVCMSFMWWQSRLVIVAPIIWFAQRGRAARLTGASATF